MALEYEGTLTLSFLPGHRPLRWPGFQFLTANLGLQLANVSAHAFEKPARTILLSLNFSYRFANAANLFLRAKHMPTRSSQDNLPLARKGIAGRNAGPTAGVKGTTLVGCYAWDLLLG